MPWSVRKTNSCPASKPWGVIKDSDGTVEGCHPTEAAANRQRAALYASESSYGGTMKHKTLEMKAVATDLGEFVAIAAAYSVDRYNERIVKGAFAMTIAKWQESGKRIPLHWDHE